MFKTLRIRCLIAAVLLCLAQIAFASDVKVGLEIEGEGEGFLFNPIVTKINVTGVEPESLAARAGIAEGDEITSLEGQSVEGCRVSELKAGVHEVRRWREQNVRRSPCGRRVVRGQAHQARRMSSHVPDMES